MCDLIVSCNCEAKSSELLEHIEKMLPRYYMCNDIFSINPSECVTVTTTVLVMKLHEYQNNSMLFILDIVDATTITQEAFPHVIQNLEEILRQHYMHSDI